jgi:hypothetical protein
MAHPSFRRARIVDSMTGARTGDEEIRGTLRWRDAEVQRGRWWFLAEVHRAMAVTRARSQKTGEAWREPTG